MTGDWADEAASILKRGGGMFIILEIGEDGNGQLRYRAGSIEALRGMVGKIEEAVQAIAAEPAAGGFGDGEGGSGNGQG
jgi:hypothetical protein